MIDEHQKEWIVAWCLFGAICLGLVIGQHCGEETMKDEAIAHQSARYIVNPTTGETSFEWLHP